MALMDAEWAARHPELAPEGGENVEINAPVAEIDPIVIPIPDDPALQGDASISQDAFDELVSIQNEVMQALEIGDGVEFTMEDFEVEE